MQNRYKVTSLSGYLSYCILFFIGVMSVSTSYADHHAEAATSTAQKVWSPANGFADLIEKVSPAVVHVAIKGEVSQRKRRGPRFNFPPGSPFEDFFTPFNSERENDSQSKKKRTRPLGIGSGFIISAEGLVVTNHHVIKDADEIIVTLSDGREFEAKLKGGDKKTDLALLQLEGAKNLPFVKFGNDTKSRVGDWVLAIGNPFGLGGSASTGIISALGRDINSGPYDDYIQVDAAINRGNSGGPLFNMQGEVIGVNTAIYSPNGGSVGIGFSIAASLAESVISQLQKNGEVARGWIGVQIQPLDKSLAEGFGLDNEQGALIASVVPNKPADKAGLKPGDIIISFNGKKIEQMRDLPKSVALAKVGDVAKIQIWRDGKKQTLSIRIDAYPTDDEVLALGNNTQQESESNSIGATLRSIDDDARKQYRLNSKTKGVLVLQVKPDGLAANNGLRRADVIVAVNNKKVYSPVDVTKQIQQANKNGRNKVVLLLRRQNSIRFIPFSLTNE